MKKEYNLDILINEIEAGPLFIDPKVKSDNFQNEIIEEIKNKVQVVDKYYKSRYALFKIPSKRSKYEKLIDKYCSSEKLLIICSQNEVKKFIRWSNVKYVRYFEYSIFNEKSYVILVEIKDLNIEQEFIEMSKIEKIEEETKITYTPFVNFLRWSLLFGPIIFFIYIIYLQIFA